MENLLKKIFDLQRFEENRHLETIIRDTERRYEEAAEGVPDEELDFVNAAGEVAPVIVQKTETGGNK